LVTAEYCTGSDEQKRRVMTWNLDASTGKIQVDSDGRCRTDEGYQVEDKYRRIQGAVSQDGTWYLRQSNNKTPGPS
jgi:hypothetical protein